MTTTNTTSESGTMATATNWKTTTYSNNSSGACELFLALVTKKGWLFLVDGNGQPEWCENVGEDFVVMDIEGGEWIVSVNAKRVIEVTERQCDMRTYHVNN